MDLPPREGVGATINMCAGEESLSSPGVYADDDESGCCLGGDLDTLDEAELGGVPISAATSNERPVRGRMALSQVTEPVPFADYADGGVGCC